MNLIWLQGKKNYKEKSFCWCYEVVQNVRRNCEWNDKEVHRHIISGLSCTQGQLYQMTSECDCCGGSIGPSPIPQTTPVMTFCWVQALISHRSIPTCDLVSLIFNGTRHHPLWYNPRLNSEWKIQISPPLLWVCGLISHTTQSFTTKLIDSVWMHLHLVGDIFVQNVVPRELE